MNFTSQLLSHIFLSSTLWAALGFAQQVWLVIDRLIGDWELLLVLGILSLFWSWWAVFLEVSLPHLLGSPLRVGRLACRLLAVVLVSVSIELIIVLFIDSGLNLLSSYLRLVLVEAI